MFGLQLALMHLLLLEAWEGCSSPEELQLCLARPGHKGYAAGP